ncbi:unnamed protein product [Caretta caretta]
MRGGGLSAPKLEAGAGGLPFSGTYRKEVHRLPGQRSLLEDFLVRCVTGRGDYQRREAKRRPAGECWALEGLEFGSQIEP